MNDPEVIQPDSPVFRGVQLVEQQIGEGSFRGGVANPLYVANKLYGRQAEEESLLGAFNRVALGDEHHPELVLITGPSGTGKVRVSGTDTCRICITGKESLTVFL